MAEHAMEIVKQRRSVRTFDGNGITDEDRAKLDAYMKDIPNPFGIHVEFRFLDAKEHGLTSPVVNGSELYIGGKVKKGANADVAFGYSFEALVLCAQALGIGTVWIGGTMNRDAFEKAMELGADEMMPCVTPVGYPAKKMSLREIAMRKGVGADKREAAEVLFFENTFDHPLKPETGSFTERVLEMIRWAPSAVNKQPWRVVVSGNVFHFYEKKTKGYVSEATGDLQKVDVGIALYHFAYAAEAETRAVSFEISDPEIAVPEDVEYIASYRV